MDKAIYQIFAKGYFQNSLQDGKFGVFIARGIVFYNNGSNWDVVMKEVQMNVNQLRRISVLFL